MFILTRTFITRAITSLLLLFVMALVLDYWKSRAESQSIKVAATQVLGQYRGQLSSVLTHNLNLTAGMKSYVAVHPDLTQQQFSKFANNLLKHDSQIRNVGVAKDLIISHIYPVEGNEKALGLNYRNVPIQYASVKRTLLNDEILIDAPVSLVQGGLGIIARQKVINANDNSLWGIISVVIDYDLIFKTINANFPKIKVAIKQAEAPFSSIYGDQSIFENAQATTSISLPLGAWRISMDWQDDSVLQQHNSWIIYAAMFFLWLLTLALFHRELHHRESLQKQTEKAQQASLAKSQFLANMSHEIRTPLNGVIGTLQLLKKSTLNHSQQKLAENALFSARKLLSIISNILDFSKIEANKLEIELTEFYLQDIIEFVEFTLTQSAIDKGLSFTISQQPDLPQYWVGDPTRIGQILLNLVGNAIKFTEKGKVAVHFGYESKEQTDTLIINIEDTGLGMDDAEISRAFEPFSQADASISRRFGGTGLGLIICKNLVEALDGIMQVKSVKELGTKFEIRLPMQIAQPKHLETIEHQQNLPNLRGKRILIAEDNEINMLVLQSALQPTGASLEKAVNGLQAIEKYEEMQIDLIIMDIQMPEMDGITAINHIRKKDQHIPVIACTANVFSHDIENYQKQGFSAYIGKPFELDTLYELLNQHLSNTQES